MDTKNYYNAGNSNEFRTAGEVCPVVVQKGVGNMKSRIREKAQDIMLMYVEVEKQDIVIVSLSGIMCECAS